MNRYTYFLPPSLATADVVALLKADGYNVEVVEMLAVTRRAAPELPTELKLPNYSRPARQEAQWKRERKGRGR